MSPRCVSLLCIFSLASRPGCAAPSLLYPGLPYWPPRLAVSARRSWLRTGGAVNRKKTTSHGRRGATYCEARRAPAMQSECLAMVGCSRLPGRAVARDPRLDAEAEEARSTLALACKMGAWRWPGSCRGIGAFFPPRSAKSMIAIQSRFSAARHPLVRRRQFCFAGCVKTARAFFRVHRGPSS